MLLGSDWSVQPLTDRRSTGLPKAAYLDLPINIPLSERRPWFARFQDGSMSWVASPPEQLTPAVVPLAAHGAPTQLA